MSYRELFVAKNPLITYVKDGVPNLVEVLGVPFDSTSTFRLGSKFGANAIREAFLNIEIYSNRLNVDLENCPINDLGNLCQIGDAKRMSSSLKKVVSEILSDCKVPAILGGEHTLSYATFNAMPKNTGFIVFDAHADLRNEFVGISFSHTTWLRRFIEKQANAENVIHVGLRAASQEEVDYKSKVGLQTITTNRILTTKHSEKVLLDFVKQFNQLYISIDMDILDPAYAPGVGNPEAAGISTAQLLEFLYVLEGRKLLGFDIVEVCPQYDTGITAIAASKLMLELISLVHKYSNKK